MSSGPRAPAGAVPHTLKMTVFFFGCSALASGFASLAGLSAAGCSLLAVAAGVVLASVSLLSPLLATAPMTPMTRTRARMPPQPSLMFSPTLFFFGGGGGAHPDDADDEAQGEDAAAAEPD